MMVFVVLAVGKDRLRNSLQHGEGSGGFGRTVSGAERVAAGEFMTEGAD